MLIDLFWVKHCFSCSKAIGVVYISCSSVILYESSGFAPLPLSHNKMMSKYNQDIWLSTDGD